MPLPIGEDVKREFNQLLDLRNALDGYRNALRESPSDVEKLANYLLARDDYGRQRAFVLAMIDQTNDPTENPVNPPPIP